MPDALKSHLSQTGSVPVDARGTLECSVTHQQTDCTERAAEA